MNKMIFLFKSEWAQHGGCTVKHIYYTQIGAENLERFLRICMSLRRQSMHMANGI